MKPQLNLWLKCCNSSADWTALTASSRISWTRRSCRGWASSSEECRRCSTTVSSRSKIRATCWSAPCDEDRGRKRSCPRQEQNSLAPCQFVSIIPCHVSVLAWTAAVSSSLTESLQRKKIIAHGFYDYSTWIKCHVTLAICFTIFCSFCELPFAVLVVVALSVRTRTTR